MDELKIGEEVQVKPNPQGAAVGSLPYSAKVIEMNDHSVKLKAGSSPPFHCLVHRITRREDGVFVYEAPLS
jgi:hypothetical protein